MVNNEQSEEKFFNFCEMKYYCAHITRQKVWFETIYSLFLAFEKKLVADIENLIMNVLNQQESLVRALLTEIDQVF